MVDEEDIRKECSKRRDKNFEVFSCVYVGGYLIEGGGTHAEGKSGGNEERAT